VHPSEWKDPRAASVAHRRTTTAPPRVLVEDPDPAWQRMMASLLHEHGYDAVFCTGPEALPGGCSLTNNRTCPHVETADVILNSLDLERADNRAVLAALRTAYPRTPVVALVSRQEGREHPGCVHGCTLEYFPTSPRRLLKRLEEALEAVP